MSSMTPSSIRARSPSLRALASLSEDRSTAPTLSKLRDSSFEPPSFATEKLFDAEIPGRI